jgi:hypothetical protein
MNELTPSKVESFSGLIMLMLVYLYYHVSNGYMGGSGGV